MSNELTDFSEEWIEKRKKTGDINGSQMVVDKKTGYLQSKRADGLTALQKQSLIGSLNQRWNLAKAMNTAEIKTRRVVYDHIAIDPLFREHFVEACERHIDNAEEMVFDNAENNPRASAERVFLLKKRRAKIYGDTIGLQGGGADEELVKKLAESMSKYTMIPKDSVIDVKQDNE